MNDGIRGHAVKRRLFFVQNKVDPGSRGFGRIVDIDDKRFAGAVVVDDYAASPRVVADLIGKK